MEEFKEVMPLIESYHHGIRTVGYAKVALVMYGRDCMELYDTFGAITADKIIYYMKTFSPVLLTLIAMSGKFKYMDNIVRLRSRYPPEDQASLGAIFLLTGSEHYAELSKTCSVVRFFARNRDLRHTFFKTMGLVLDAFKIYNEYLGITVTRNVPDVDPLDGIASLFLEPLVPNLKDISLDLEDLGIDANFSEPSALLARRRRKNDIKC
jgi:hypothetical protein